MKMQYLIGVIIIGLIIYLYSYFKKEDDLMLTDEFKEILKTLNETNENIFITGKAGTGKSTLLKYFKERTKKKVVVLAPTGVAALNVGGQTIHSFFHFPPAIVNPNQITPDYGRGELFKNIQTIVIDEVSMVRSDLMNGIDIALRKNRNRLNEPFGGVQMVFIGDLYQLPPVLPPSEREEIIQQFGGEYFFDAPVFKDYQYSYKELTRVFRQSEEDWDFKNLLNKIRNNTVEFDDMVLLNSRHIDNVGEQDNSIFLTTRRDIAKNINTEKLAELEGPEFEFIGVLEGEYLRLRNEDEDKLEKKLPAPYRLKLKKGAQIMMLKNDPNKRWVNGSIGKITEINENKIVVRIKGKHHRVEREIWKEIQYIANNGEIEEKTIAEFKQYPISLAYAVTIHKGQGKTFDKITVDIGAGAFAHGQVYVAISRCTSLKGIVLNNIIDEKDIIVDPRVVEFHGKLTN